MNAWRLVRAFRIMEPLGIEVAFDIAPCSKAYRELETVVYGKGKSKGKGNGKTKGYDHKEKQQNASSTSEAVPIVVNASDAEMSTGVSEQASNTAGVDTAESNASKNGAKKKAKGRKKK